MQAVKKSQHLALHQTKKIQKGKEHEDRITEKLHPVSSEGDISLKWMDISCLSCPIIDIEGGPSALVH